MVFFKEDRVTEANTGVNRTLRRLTCKTWGSEASQAETPHQEGPFLPAAVSSLLRPPEGAQPSAHQFLLAATRGRTALRLPIPWTPVSKPKCAVTLSHMDFGCV